MTVHFESWGSQAGNYGNPTSDDVAGFDIYVSGRNGDDTNDGVSSDTPIATLAEAYRRVCSFSGIRQPVRIHVGRNTADAAYEAPAVVFPPFTGPKGSLAIMGDGAGQAGEDGFTTLLAAQASGGSSTTSAIHGTFGGTNNYRGKTLLVTTGAAAGARRTIYTNSTTIATVNVITGFVAGDSFRIVEPNVTLDVGAESVLSRQAGVLAPSPGVVAAYAPGVYFANLKVSGDANVEVQRGGTYLYGVECTDQMLGVYAGAMCGAGANVQDGPESIGLETVFGVDTLGDAATSGGLWSGWGFADARGTAVLGGVWAYGDMCAFGFYVMPGLVLQDGSFDLCGGSIYGCAGLSTVSALRRSLFVARSGTTLLGSNNLPTVYGYAGAWLTLDGSVSALAANAEADCVKSEGAQITVGSAGTFTTSHASATTFNALFGGSIHFDAGLTVAGTGTFATVNNKVGTSTKASFTSAGFAIQGVGSPTPAANLSGGLIRRYA